MTFLLKHMFLLPLYVNVFGQLDIVYDKLFQRLRKDYDKYVRPFQDEGSPTMINVFMYIGSLRSVSEATMAYELELYFREYWKDPRLAFEPLLYNNMTRISLHETHAEMLWLPDTFLPNAIQSGNPSPGSVTHRSLLRLEASGHILYSRRVSVTAECPMELSLYPFDKQICALSIESYGHGTDDVVYSWRGKKPVSINDELELPEFQIEKMWTISRNITLATGEYSRLELCFLLSRNPGLHFVQTFFPATSVVLCSWLFIWMRKTSSWRDMISVLLACTFLYFSLTSSMPKVSYLKAVDLYLTACFVLVFFSLIKLAVMTWLKYRLDALKENPSLYLTKLSPLTHLCHEETIGWPAQTHYLPKIVIRMIKPLEQSGTFQCLKIFKAMAIGIPLSFVLFAVSYFTAYLVLVDHTPVSECQQVV